MKWTGAVNWKQTIFTGCILTHLYRTYLIPDKLVSSNSPQVMPTAPVGHPALGNHLCPSLPDGRSSGLGSDRWDGVLQRSCVGLGDVCGHPLLGSHHRPLHRLPQPGSRQGYMGPVEQSGNQAKDKAVKVLTKWQQL